MSIASTDDFSDLASVKSDSSGGVLEDLKGTIEKLTGEIEKLKGQGGDSVEELRIKMAEQDATIQKLTEENGKLRGGAKNEKGILTSIIGSWRMVSSTGMKEYLENFSETERSGMFGAVLEAGLPNFFFDKNEQKLTMFEAIGSQEHNKKTVKLGEKCVLNGIKEVTFVEDNSLITVYFHENGKDEISREKRFVKDGQLHIVTKRFGTKCTRVYQKALTMIYRTTESDGAKELRKIFGELEEEFVQQKKALMKEHEQQKIEWERKLEIEQKNNETISEQLKLAIEKAAELEESPEKFKNKLLGTWSAMDGSDYMHFMVKDGLLTHRRGNNRDVTLYPASKEDILSKLSPSAFSHQYSDTMAFIYDMHSRKILYFFVEGRLVACNLSEGNQCQYFKKLY